MNYEDFAKSMKALSDPNRVKMMDLLSYETMCACDLLEYFDFTQSSLSHHMKILKEVGLVTTEKIGKWHYYTVNQSAVESISRFGQEIFSNSEACICHKVSVTQ